MVVNVNINIRNPFERNATATEFKKLTCYTSNAEEAEVEQFYEDLQDLLELTPPKYVLLIIGVRSAK